MAKSKTKKLPLSQGKFAIVDADFEPPLNGKGRPSKYHLAVTKNGHMSARACRFNARHYLHNDVWRFYDGDVPDGVTVDHIDRDALNNVRCNLRLATVAEQSQNRRKPRKSNSWSKFKGVCFEVREGRWCAQIDCDGSRKFKRFSGDGKGEIAAARQYDEWARELHGEFAVLNFPDGDSRK